MTLIKSISGIRGTIGGQQAENLTPLDIIKFTISFGSIIKNKYSSKVKFVIGRDARISGEMISKIISSSLNSIGIEVVDLELSTTPTVEFAVKNLKAQGGIIITASHNQKEWNALKLLNDKGEFIDEITANEVVELTNNLENFEFEKIDNLGKYYIDTEQLDLHIDKILALKIVDKEIIKKKNPKILIDAINSTGSISIEKLMNKLQITNFKIINNIMNGNFVHNPEPLRENLDEICEKMKNEDFDIGIVVDPDVDRLCFVCENGDLFGEEYTLVAIADYITSKTPGNCVSNLSSTRALRDICIKNNSHYFTSKVGEVNVVTKMKEKNAIIGGEGNGGVIYPENHYGRDALAGIALFLSYYSNENLKMTQLKNKLPQYFMSKNKIDIDYSISLDSIFEKMYLKYKDKESCNTEDGLKIDFEYSWVHLRKSNTESIIRIYSEAKTQSEAIELANRFVLEIKSLL